MMNVECEREISRTEVTTENSPGEYQEKLDGLDVTEQWNTIDDILDQLHLHRTTTIL